MGVSPSRSSLYRTLWRFVIYASLALRLASPMPAQVGARAKVKKGPRAIGLIQLAPDGKARLIPIAILIEGQYYDAGAYKASPVPMALWSETVYEGIRTGVSQGLFTVTGALENPATHEWFAEGTWQTASAVAAKGKKNKASAIPRGMEDDEGPPVLRHAGAATPKAPEAASSPAAPPSPAPSTSSTAPPAAPAVPPSATSPPPASTPASPPPSEAEDKDRDKDRPMLKRGKPAAEPAEVLTSPTVVSAKPGAASAPSSMGKSSQMQLIPAISDEKNPETQTFAYNLQPDEEAQLRNKMLAMAGDEVRARVAPQTSGTTAASKPSHVSPQRKAGGARLPQPDFQDVQLRVFDLSSSNEPVLVLTAKAQMPKTTNQKQNASPDVQYMLTLVARQDINADLHKVFSNVTDASHLDVRPQYELIDAVDVDGDERGELLFRKVFDAGSAFAFYRVIGDQLYPLFQGTP